MAITKIWDSNNPYNTIWYITQPEKTDPHTSAKCLLISTRKCWKGEGSYADDISKQFQKTKEVFEKEKGIQCFHAVQSFAPGETTPEEAHKIGMELAREIWADFQVVVATHTDKGHIHNHFCINSVSCVDGHKYLDNKASYKRLREVSDRLCKEHGLSVINNPSKDGHKNYREKEGEKNGEVRGVRGWIREDIDRLLPLCHSLEDLFQALEEIGYVVKRDAAHVALKPPGKDGFFRLYKMGKGYTEEDLFDRIQQSIDNGYTAPRYNTDPGYTIVLRQTYTYLYRRRKPSVMGVYLRYRHLAKQPGTQYPDMRIREARRDLRKVTEKTILLCDNRIHTQSDLDQFKSKLMFEKKDRMAERQRMRNRLAREDNPDKQVELRELIAKKSAVISSLNRQIKLCDEIKEESNEIAKAVAEQGERLKREEQNIEREEIREKERERNEER